MLITGLLLAACAPTPAAVEKIAPAKVEKIEGSDLKRVTLTEKAAERLNIQTIAVREEQVTRTRTVGGVVVVPPDGADPGPGKVWVRVLLTEGDFALVDQNQPALIRSLDDDDEDGDEADDLMAEADDGPELDDAGEDDADEVALYYVVDNTGNHLLPGQRVFVELILSGSGSAHKIIPYTTVIYDVNGETWVYTNPEPLVFIRESIQIDYIEGDTAFLREGPAAGTQIVTVGGAELYGTETGVSK
jgi:hypothetical protein